MPLSNSQDDANAGRGLVSTHSFNDFSMHINQEGMSTYLAGFGPLRGQAITHFLNLTAMAM